MGTKVRKRRTLADISRLSAQTRLSAWTIYTDLMRKGMDSGNALHKALKEACPPQDDPYYHSFYPNKMRELELWRKHCLWPLSKPKDIEHDTGPYDTVEVAADVHSRALGNADVSSSFTLLLDAEGLDDEDRIDTLEFDPVEVAKIIDSYELDATMFSGETSESCATSLIQEGAHGPGESLFPNPPFSYESVTSEQEGVSSGHDRTGDGSHQAVSPPPLPGVSICVKSAPGSSPAGGHDLMSWVELDQDTLNELLAMVAWWKAHKEHLTDPNTPVLLRPQFTHKHLQTKRIALNGALWAEAEDAAKKQAEISGGTLPGLVEYLLWRHLGSPKKHLKK